MADRTRFTGGGNARDCHSQKRAVWSMQHRLRVATSRIAGWGVFATKHIGVHDVIAEYMGEVVSGVVRLLLRCHTRRFASPAFMAAAATQLCSLVCSPRRVVGPGSGRRRARAQVQRRGPQGLHVPHQRHRGESCVPLPHWLSSDGFYIGWLRRPLTCVPAPLPRHRL